MFITIINDCRDANAMGRQATRSVALMNAPVHTLGVQNDLEAAGNLIDVLDAAGNAKGVVLVNVAPRNGRAKKYPNGTPFGYFYYKNVLVLSSIDGHTLSMVKKLGITDHIELFDIPTVLGYGVKRGLIDPYLEEYISDTQFRSFDFLPRAATWLLDSEELPTERISIDEVEDAPHSIWFIDNFGNCKTTMLPEEIDFGAGKKLSTHAGDFVCFPHLKDIPDEHAALVIGSSGIEKQRFIEIMLQGGSAAAKLNIHSGDTLDK